MFTDVMKMLPEAGSGTVDADIYPTRGVELGVDLGPRVLNQPLDAGHAGFSIRFGNQNHIAVQLQIAPLDLHHHGQFRGQ